MNIQSFLKATAMGLVLLAGLATTTEAKQRRVVTTQPNARIAANALKQMKAHIQQLDRDMGSRWMVKLKDAYACKLYFGDHDSPRAVTFSNWTLKEARVAPQHKLELVCMDGGKCIKLNHSRGKMVVKTSLVGMAKRSTINASLVKIRKACRTYRENTPAGGAKRTPARAPVRRR